LAAIEGYQQSLKPTKHYAKGIIRRTRQRHPHKNPASSKMAGKPMKSEI